MPPKRDSKSERVSSASPRGAGPSRAVALAAARFKGLTFEDPISLQRVGKSRGVTLNKQTYDARGLRSAMQAGHARVPHSRRPIARREEALIMAKSRDDIAILNTQASPSLPPVRLPMRYTKSRVVNATQARALVADEVGSDCWAFALESPKGNSVRVIFNRYALSSHDDTPKREGKARTFIMNNPGSVLKRLRASPGSKAVMYMFEDAGLVIIMQYTGDGKYRCEYHAKKQEDL